MLVGVFATSFSHCFVPPLGSFSIFLVYLRLLLNALQKVRVSSELDRIAWKGVGGDMLPMRLTRC